MERVPYLKPKIAGPSVSRHKQYDQTKRDPGSRAFYKGAVWKRVQKLQVQRVPYCEECMRHNRLVRAEIVHHKVELKVDPSRALDFDNLESLCRSCHSRLHGRQRGVPRT